MSEREHGKTAGVKRKVLMEWMHLFMPQRFRLHRLNGECLRSVGSVCRKGVRTARDLWAALLHFDAQHPTRYRGMLGSGSKGQAVLLANQELTKPARFSCDSVPFRYLLQYAPNVFLEFAPSL